MWDLCWKEKSWLWNPTLLLNSLLSACCGPRNTKVSTVYGLQDPMVQWGDEWRQCWPRHSEMLPTGKLGGGYWATGVVNKIKAGQFQTKRHTQRAEPRGWCPASRRCSTNVYTAHVRGRSPERWSGFCRVRGLTFLRSLDLLQGQWKAVDYF